MTNGNDIVPTHLVVRAMRDNGYKNAAYAIAELMDNAIQAEASQVELLCAERAERVNTRVSRRIKELGVLDNGLGMSSDVLRMALQFGNGTRLNDFSGIGRFGMGLPNSSISQARRVDVWTWQDGVASAIHSYLDIDEIEAGTLASVPKPEPREIPEIWTTAGDAFGSSGTLVVWSKLDRIMWRTASSIIDHSEAVIGRMYRYFLADGSVEIRFKTIDLDDVNASSVEDVRLARPNDPLYLLPDTSCPPPYDEEPMFTQGDYEDKQFYVQFNGETHAVTVRFAYAKEEAREGYNPGSRPYGRHARDNAGVSIVRAHRELDLDAAWTDPSDPRDRWWGVEVRFPPALDDLFGVTNNKQYARHFSELAKADLESLAPEGQSLGATLEALDADDDPRLPLLSIANHIRSNIRVLRALLKAQTSGTSQQRHSEASSPEAKGTQASRTRIEQGYATETDEDEERLPPDEREAAIRHELVVQGTPERQAEELAAHVVASKSKYTIVKSNIASPAFFDVRPKGGAIVIGLNVEHPAYDHLIEVLRDDGEHEDDVEALRQRLAEASEGLELLLMAWARYEDEQPDGGRRSAAQEARWDWGRMAKQFLATD